jgi:hypothetical protein
VIGDPLRDVRIDLGAPITIENGCGIIKRFEDPLELDEDEIRRILDCAQ